MCYSTAAAASKEGQEAISRAVLVLLAPPVAFMTFGVGLAFRYASQRDREQPDENPADRESFLSDSSRC